MPRAGQLKSSGERLSDRVAVGVLTQAFPPGLVDEVLAETGRVQQRNRLLPARLVVYFVLAMCLFSGQGYEEVARLLTMGLQGERRWRASWAVPSTAAIWKARSRLGVAPLRELFARVCRPVAARGTQGAFHRGWRLTAIDGTTFDLPDTTANVEAFGRPPRSGRGEQNVGYPQIRMVGLVECGTHAVFDAALGPLRTGEQALARAVLPSLRPGMMLLADRGFYSVDLWCKAAATGADLLWRVRKDLVLPVVEQLPDGSYLTEIFDRSDIHHTRRGMPARATPSPATRASTGSSPRSSTRTKPQPQNWPNSTHSDGSSSPPSTKSRPTSAVPTWYCDHSTPTEPNRNSTASCSSTTPSGT